MSGTFPKITATLMAMLLLTTVAMPAMAAPSHQDTACALDYTVQADDWLSKIAEKQYGDLLAYPVIMEATNTAAQSDGSYATITNPDLIEIGWKLCVPAAAEGMMMAGDKMMEGEMMAPAEGMMGEKTKFNVRLENVGDFKFKSSGVFNTPVGAAEPGPLVPGGIYEFTFNAAPGDRLSFSSMFVQSNDWFIAPNQAGLALFSEDGSPITGDITNQIQLWDGGTEVNQEPGLGSDQPLQQAGPNTGAADPNNTVRLATDEFGNLPAVNGLVKVMLDSPAPNEFLLRIENISTEGILTTSDGNAHPTPFAPGVWVVHTDGNPLFTEGAPDFGLGLEALAEDGDPTGLAATLTSQAGLITPFAPGVWTIHTGTDPLFTAGQPDRGQGLEALAEDGNPAPLAEALANQTDISNVGVFNIPVGADGPGPLLPGNAYEFTVEAMPGDLLSFATMFVQSNDLFYGPPGAGIALFNIDGTPVTGDVTNQIGLWDAGTEVNQTPGFGPDQAPRQTGPNSGADEDGVVKTVADGYTYPDTAGSIRVTISAQ